METIKEVLIAENERLSRLLRDALDARDKEVRRHVKSVQDMCSKLQKMVDSHAIGTDGKLR